MSNSTKRYARDIFLATHCFGEKAQAALQKINTKYKDIVDEHLENVAPPKIYTTESGDEITEYGNYVFLLVIITDDADKYASAIDTFIAQYKEKGLVGHTVVLDLHYSSHAAEYVAHWELYNVLSTIHSAVEDGLQSILLFVEEALDIHGLINLDWNDFKFILKLSVEMSCGTIPIEKGKPLIDAFPLNKEKVKGMLASVRFSNPPKDMSDPEMQSFQDFIEDLVGDADSDIEIKCSICANTGSPSVYYIAMI